MRKRMDDDLEKKKAFTVIQFRFPNTQQFIARERDFSSFISRFFFFPPSLFPFLSL